MRTRVGIGVAVVVSAMLAPIGAWGGVAHASNAPAIRGVPLHSSYESSTRVVSRDDGLSVALPDGHELWLFGDTGIYQRSDNGSWTLTNFIDGSTALEARYTRGEVPSGGEYPGGVPARFIPVPHDVYLPDGSGGQCNSQTAAFAARWPTGAAVMQSDPTEVLVSYSEVCITHVNAIDDAITAEGWGYMLYNWKTHHIDRGPIDVFKPQVSGQVLGPAHIYGSPIFGDGHVTFFASRCTNAFVVCNRGQVSRVTMPDTIAALDNPASYKAHQAPITGSAKWQPLSISVGRYSDGLRLIEMTSIAGTYAMFSAPSIGAPWRLVQSGTLPGCPTRTGFCFAFAGHPELSTPSETFVSYDNPDSGPGGHIVIAALAWP